MRKVKEHIRKVKEHMRKVMEHIQKVKEHIRKVKEHIQKVKEHFFINLFMQKKNQNEIRSRILPHDLLHTLIFHPAFQQNLEIGIINCIGNA